MQEIDNEIELIHLSNEGIELYWERIEPWVDISRGVDKTYSTEDIKKCCIDGEFQLWVIRKQEEVTGFLVTSVIANPQGRICYGAWLGGENLSEWVKPGLAKLEIWAKDQDCVGLSFIGRKAWQRLLDFDANYEGTYYFKKLVN